MMSTYYNDNEPCCCAVLRKNIARGYLPEGTVDERDIKTVTSTDLMGYTHVHLFAGIGGFPLGLTMAGWPTRIRTLTGGFPCQDISYAGEGAGIEGERSGLWKEMYRLIRDAKVCGMGYDFIFVENVAALVHRGLSTVLGDLAQIGYDAQWGCLRASDMGAPHQRERLFLVAYTLDTRRKDTWGIRPTEISRWQEPGRKQGASGTRRSGTSNMGDTGSLMVRRTGADIPANMAETPTSTEREGANSICNSSPRTSGVGLADANGSRPAQSWQPGRLRTTTQPGTPATTERGSCVPDGPTGQSEPSVCGGPYGLSAGLDGHRWPAGPSQEQHEWEPARTITATPNRAARLKALGNAIVPQCVALVATSIMGMFGLYESGDVA